MTCPRRLLIGSRGCAVRPRAQLDGDRRLSGQPEPALYAADPSGPDLLSGVESEGQSLSWYSNDANSHYNALLAQVQRRFARNFEIDAQYR